MIKITKSSFALIISMLMVTAIISCEKEEAAVGQDDLSGETEQDFSGSLIRVMGETSGGGTTKTTLEGLETWWKGQDLYGKNADNVGIYSPQARPTSGGAPGVVNVEFIAENTGKSSEFAGEMYWDENIPHNFYSYYPWAFGSHDFTVVPISLPDQQFQFEGNNSGAIGLRDFMLATPLTGVSPGGEGDETSGVNFQYNHVFTLLEFQVTGTGTLSKVKLAGPGTLAFNGGTIDITQGTPDAGVAYTIAGMTGESDEITVTLTTAVDLGVEPVSVYMMINPGDHSGDMAIGLELDGDYTYMAKSPPEGGFERGKKYEVPVNSGDFANEVTFTYRSVEVTYGIVLGTKGRLWMDRNLGASRVATAYNDSEAYGDLFQWGRLDDGHQDRGSETTTTLSATDDPGHDKFISNGTDPPYDWRDPRNDDLWQGDGSINDVCPAGWRVPTETELDEERESWDSNNYNGAFASPLKLVAGGFRNLDTNVYQEGSRGFYWSSTVSSSNSYDLYFTNETVGMQSSQRVPGKSVRCIKD